MLVEQLIASVGAPTISPVTNAGKDVGIFVHEYQPLNVQRMVFKKSTTLPNCLAISATHVFAAQANKAIVQVYNREKGNQEAAVPFTERITSIALACDETVLILGTKEGRIFLWEIASGRQVTTSQSHLQDITALVVDPSSNFLLSASADSMIHVWSIPHLLSFSNTGLEPLTPLRTFSSHKSGVNSLAVGHSLSFCNFAVSASTDRVCLVWDYYTNTILRTVLLSSVPTCLSLDPADRAIYVGLTDGNVQQLDLFASESGSRTSFSSTQNIKKSDAPIQPPRASTWLSADSSTGVVNCLSVSFDGTTLLSGHESGIILVWDTARRGSPTSLLQAHLPAPVTNLSFLPVIGFVKECDERLKVPTIVKPRFGAFDSPDGATPQNYALKVQLTSKSLVETDSKFTKALSSPLFHAKLLDDGLNEILRWSKNDGGARMAAGNGDAEDFMALEGDDNKSAQVALGDQCSSLMAELEALRRLQTASFEKIERLTAERNALIQREQNRILTLSSGNNSVLVNGISNTSQEWEGRSISSDED